jgi:hypothetical protein
MEKSKIWIKTLLLLIMVLISGCSAIESIFEAGFWAGLIGAIIVILVIWGIVKLIKSIGK